MGPARWGRKRTRRLPPLARSRPIRMSPERDIDLLFVGNLHTPNNVEGLRWFTNEVLPMLRRRMAPRTPRIVFAGSEPDEDGLDLWRNAGIVCAPNPSDVSVFYSRARAVMNPLQQGSGVNLKMIEALASGRPVVATPAAIRGLPDRSVLIRVCSTPEDSHSRRSISLRRRKTGGSGGTRRARGRVLRRRDSAAVDPRTPSIAPGGDSPACWHVNAADHSSHARENSRGVGET